MTTDKLRRLINGHPRPTRLTTICALVVTVALALAGTSCNARKKNTAAARQYTAFITRYNIYYNGDKHYNETLEDMERQYEDDYSTMLLMHPAEARANEKLTQPSGDFNRSIEKAQKAIQLRSITKKPAKQRGKASDPEYKAWMKREEYNPFLHNAWMMMGRSQYMNGDFLGAASTFFYTSRRFNWLPATVTEAKLWQARSYLAMDWLFEAENIVTRIKADELTDKELRLLYNMDMAELYIKSHEPDKAAPFLEAAIGQASGVQKTRLWFLLGQVYSRAGDRERAYKAFGKAGSASNATYRTKFNARIKQSEVYTGSDIEAEIKALRRMTRYDRNKEYLDQVYYAIGNIYLSRGDTAQAITNYREAVEKSTRSGIDKALAQVTLGNLYYDRRDYELAQPCYSEAVPQLPEDYPDIATLRRRSDVLDELALYSQNVHLQDSLLHLSTLTPEMQLKIVNKIIDELKKKEKEEAEAARREAYMAEQQSQGSNLQNSNNAAPATFTMNTDGSWYFYNTPTRNAGKTEFQRRWGSRKLEDDWRRRNKSSFNTADFDSDKGDSETDESSTPGEPDESADTTPADEETRKRSEDPHYPEFYLKQIPTTEAEKATAHEIIQEGLYNMGVILKDKLDDYPAARAEFDRLMSEYPENVYRPEVYYNMYLMYAREDNTREAQRYRNLILANFPESTYGVAMTDPNYLDNLKAMDKVQNGLYEQAYDAYLDNDNRMVHNLYNEMTTKYPLSPLMPKFMFLHALAYVTERNPEGFNATLRELLERYPDTDITPIAGEWLKGMAKGRELRAGMSGSNVRGMLWDIALTNDTTASGEAADVTFTLNDGDRQLLVFVFPTDRVDRNQLLYDIARHNFNSFVVKDFDLEVMNFGRLGMIVVKDFDNLDELNHYRRVMAGSQTFKLPAGVRPVPISAPNFDALLRSGATLDSYFRFLDEQNYLDAQSGLLPYEEIETLPEEQPVPTEPAVETPAAQPSEPPGELPATTPQPAPQATPQTKPEPKREPAPLPPPVPAYEPGSEGDDPLLD